MLLVVQRLVAEFLVAEQVGDLLLVLQVDPRLKARTSVSWQGHRPTSRPRVVCSGQHLPQGVLEHRADCAMSTGRDRLCLAEEAVVDRQRRTHLCIIASTLRIMMRPGFALEEWSQAGRTTRQTWWLRTLVITRVISSGPDSLS